MTGFGGSLLFNVVVAHPAKEKIKQQRKNRKNPREMNESHVSYALFPVSLFLSCTL
jgi:hypothetical protein